MANRVTYLCLVAALSLVGCQDTQQLQVTAKPAPLHVIAPADPAPLQLLSVRAKVLNKHNVDQFIQQAQHEQGTDNPVFVTYSTADYQSMSLNIQELNRYIMQQQSIIAYYRQAIADAASAADSQGPSTPSAKP